MPKTEIIFNQKDCLGARDFANKYGIKTKFVYAAIRLLYKQHRHAVAPTTRNLTPVIIGANSNPKIHPFFHDIVLAEAKKQEQLFLSKKSKDNEK